MYNWLLLETNSPLRKGWKRWLLVRRSVNDPKEIKAHVACAPAQTELSELDRIAGVRWAIEVSFEDAKQETGLDEYEVRSFSGWYRHIHILMFAYALGSVLKGSAGRRLKKPACQQGEPCSLQTALSLGLLSPFQQWERIRQTPVGSSLRESRSFPELILTWSHFQRTHWAIARYYHYKKQHALDSLSEALLL